jgi:hypothetical protein
MKPKLYSFLTVALFTIIFVISCKKGDTGPAGPAGPAGAAGAAGAQGPKGDSATANVTYSAWLDVSFLADTVRDPSTHVLDTLDFYAVIAAPKLTATVISQGDIKVYLNFGTSANPDVVPLPYTDVIFTNGVSIVPDFVPGQIILTSNVNPSTRTDSEGKKLQYRYIIIPGTKPASLNPNLKWSDYNSVKKYLNLPN